MEIEGQKEDEPTGDQASWAYSCNFSGEFSCTSGSQTGDAGVAWHFNRIAKSTPTQEIM